MIRRYCVRTYGQTNNQTVRRTGGRTNKQPDRRMHVRTVGRTDRRSGDGRTEKRTNILKNRQTDGHTDEWWVEDGLTLLRTDVRKDGRLDRWAAEGRKDIPTDGRMDEWTVVRLVGSSHG